MERHSASAVGPSAKKVCETLTTAGATLRHYGIDAYFRAVNAGDEARTKVRIVALPHAEAVVAPGQHGAPDQQRQVGDADGDEEHNAEARVEEAEARANAAGGPGHHRHSCRLGRQTAADSEALEFAGKGA